MSRISDGVPDGRSAPSGNDAEQAGVAESAARTGTRKPGIVDVALESGFSPTTVSHALNGRGRVNENTKQIIEAVAERLGYRANPNARKMRGASTGLIGLIAQLPEGSSWGVADLEFLVRLERSFCDSAVGRELYPIILSSANVGNAVRSIPLDGAVLVDPLPSDATLALLLQERIPVVTLGRDIAREEDRLWWADNDKHAVTVDALDALHQRGMRSVALLSARTGQNYMTDVVEAFDLWIEQHDVQGRVLEFPAPFDQSECFRVVQRLCEERAIDTIYLGVETFLQPTLEAIRASELSVPGDVQIMMASDGGAARSSRPSVSAIDLHPERLGVATLDLLVELIEDPRRAPLTQRVAADIAFRETTRPLPAAVP